jgi:predicted ArsR family transcriptional regulator
LPVWLNFLNLKPQIMLLPVFQDLIKLPWRKVLEELKLAGGLPVSELSRQVGASYMAVKQQCEELRKIGYLSRIRVPRTVVGRPEIFYQLTAKADALFPEAGLHFTLDLLDELRQHYGDNSPDKLLFQYFETQLGIWQKRLEKFETPLERATKLAALRIKDGCFGRAGQTADGGFRIEEYHNPLQRIFERYPRAVVMEQRLLEQLLGSRMVRREMPVNGSLPAHVVFDVPAL